MEIKNLASLTKEQLLALWEAEQNGINNAHAWLKYLENLADPSGFNTVVWSNLLRVIDKYARQYSYEWTDDPANFELIRKETKDMCLYLPEFKVYFKVASKKQMMEYDLSLYKFE